MEVRKHVSQRTNVQQIFQKIVDHGPIYRRDLQKITGFSSGLVYQVASHLIEEGYLITKDDMAPAGVGRRAEIIDVVSDNFFFLGISIDSKGMYAVVTDMKGRIVESLRHLWPQETREAVLRSLYALLDDLMEKYKNKNIRSIGVAVQGVVDMATGVSVYICRIENWQDVPIKALLEDRYHVDVLVAHDTDCQMECERAYGLLKNTDVQAALRVHLRYSEERADCGIGMSMLIGGQPYVGHNGRAAEIGYMILGENPDGSAYKLEDEVVNRDVSALQLCNSIGKAVAVANALLNPETIVLDASECPFEEALITAVNAWVKRDGYNTSVPIRISGIGQEASARGAALLLISRAIDVLS